MKLLEKIRKDDIKKKIYHLVLYHFSGLTTVTKTINKLKKHYNINKSRNYVYTVLNEMTADGIFNSYMMKGCRFYNLKKHETVTIVEGSKR